MTAESFNMAQAAAGFFTPWIAYAVITALHLVLPGKWIKGYVKNSRTGEVLNYRLNGILVLPASIIIYVALGVFNIVPLDWLWRTRWYALAGAVTMGLIFSFAIVLPYKKIRKFFPADFWFGRLENPQYKNGRIDAKMWLYLIGAVMLQLNAISFSYHHYTTVSDPNPGVLLCDGMLSWFVWEYLLNEKVHLYTYDFIAERVGFKLGFGCLTFYPYFYAVALWAAAELPNPHHGAALYALFTLVFFSGWCLARGANMQKYYFKTAPEKSFLGIKPETLSGGGKSLLVNGFWGLSRHVNYLGEILQACGIALAVGYPALIPVWFYPLYYVGLLFTRQMDDDKICQAKYGPLWDEYKKRVKYRIIPFLY